MVNKKEQNNRAGVIIAVIIAIIEGVLPLAAASSAWNHPTQSGLGQSGRDEVTG